MLETLLISLTAVLAAASSGFSIFMLSCMKRDNKKLQSFELRFAQLDLSLKLESNEVKQAIEKIGNSVSTSHAMTSKDIGSVLVGNLEIIGSVKQHVTDQLLEIKTTFEKSISDAKREVTGIDRRFCHYCNRLVWRFDSFVDGAILCHDCKGQGKGPK